MFKTKVQIVNGVKLAPMFHWKGLEIIYISKANSHSPFAIAD
jgi:hypothetical protein